MSKKTKNQAEKKMSEIIEEEKDPMLRALQKKVRNMTKKLNQISELQIKKDLKPEQEQKVSKKQSLLLERQKYQEMIEIYKQIAGESEKIIRKLQINQLEDLATVIAIKEYNVDLGLQANQNVDNLVKALTGTTSNDLSLTQRIQEITSALIQNANNQKLKKNIREFIESNPNHKRTKNTSQCLSNQPEPRSPRSQKQRQAQIKQLQQEQKKHEGENNLIEPLTPQGPQLQNLNLYSQESQKNQKLPKQAEINAKQKLTSVEEPIPQKFQEREENLNGEQKQRPEKKENQNQDQNKDQGNKQQKRQENQGNRGSYQRMKGEGNRNYKGERYYKDKQYNKKPTFKPKNEQPKKQQSSNSQQGSDDEPQARQFKREQVRKLIEDGFIVVGKPKIKAKGKQQKDYYNHQHGKKNIHHQNQAKK